MSEARDADDQEELSGSEMTFGEHLDELRRRLFKALLATLAGLIIVFIRHEAVLAVVTAPYREVMTSLGRSPALNAFSVQGPFFISVKVSFIVGLIFTAPIWIYQIWAFIAAGLYVKERRIIYRFIPFCVVLFVGGVTFGYLVLVPIGLRYLLTFADPTVIQNTVGVSEYLGLFVLLTVVLGFAFQLPMVMVGVARAGIMTPGAFREKRKWMILGIFVAAAIITPPDPITQVLLASPLVLLFELGIVMSWFGLGAERGPIDWKAVASTLKKPAILVLLLILLADPINQIRQQEQANDRLLLPATHPVELIPYDRFLGAAVDLVYIATEEGARQVVVATGGERLQIIALLRETKHMIPLDSDPEAKGGSSARFRHVEEGQLLLTYQLVDRIAVRGVIEGLLQGFLAASEEHQPRLEPLLAKLTGLKLEGSPEEVAKAVRAWLLQHGDRFFVQQRDGAAPEIEEN